MMRDPESTVGALFDRQGVAFIGSLDEAGFPNVKAMLAPRRRDGIARFWFTTNASSQRVAQYRRDARACVYAYDRRFYRGVMLVGTMTVCEDADTKAAIWRDGDTMYYPGGPDDPDYCVLLFTTRRGRYYAKFHSEDFDVPA